MTEQKDNHGQDIKRESGIVKQTDRARYVKERLIKFFFTASGAAALILIILIFTFLTEEGINAFQQISPSDFMYEKMEDTAGSSETVFEWYPTSEPPRYSLIPLLTGTFLTAFPAVLIAAFLGILAGVYLSEVARPKLREILKPVIELYAAIPTVVLGFIMLTVGAAFFSDIFDPVNRQNALLAASGISLVIVPVIASLTDDALRTIPIDIRMASYSLGATKWQTFRRVIFPAASNGVSASLILGFGRAIGNTMIVLLVAGNASNITLNVFKSVRTMTSTIASEMGGVSQGSNHYYALFVVGIVLFIFNFILNLAADIILNKPKNRAAKF